jgi:hypothetical protein
VRPPTISTLTFRYLRPAIAASIAGPAAALVMALALVPARDWLGTTNVALLLLLVVVATAAVGGRAPGAVTAIAASLLFNAAHTAPYGTLVIEDREDMVATVLIAVVGVAVGELTHLRINADRRARRREYAVDRVHRVAELVGQQRPLDDIIHAVRTELADELGLAVVQFEIGPPDPALPVLHHTGNLDGDQARLPEQGAAVLIHRDGTPHGHLRLEPSRHHHPNHAGQIVAVVMADLIGAALSTPPTTSDVPRSPPRDVSTAAARGRAYGFGPSLGRHTTAQNGQRRSLTDRASPGQAVDPVHWPWSRTRRI